MPCTKLISKWIKDLNIKPTTLNLTEEKVGSTLKCYDTGDHFLNITPAAQTLRETINKWNLLKLISFCKEKDTVNKTKWQPTAWEKIFTNHTSDKELKKLVIQRSNNPIKMRYRPKQRILNR